MQITHYIDIVANVLASILTLYATDVVCLFMVREAFIKLSSAVHHAPSPSCLIYFVCTRKNLRDSMAAA